jgi:hypothetical protein
MPSFWLSPFLYCNFLLSGKEIITTLHVFFSDNGSYGEVELADSYGKSGWLEAEKWSYVRTL